MAIKSVTLNYNGHYGALDYNEETKELTVTIKGETQIEQKVMDFLAAPHKMEVPIDACTYHFEERTFLARDSWKDCQQVLTRLWVNTGGSGACRPTWWKTCKGFRTEGPSWIKTRPFFHFFPPE